MKNVTKWQKWGFKKNDKMEGTRRGWVRRERMQRGSGMKGHVESPWIGRMTDHQGIFTTTTRILFLQQLEIKFQMHYSEFHQWLIHFYTVTWGSIEMICTYTLVLDPQNFLNFQKLWGNKHLNWGGFPGLLEGHQVDWNNHKRGERERDSLSTISLLF